MQLLVGTSRIPAGSNSYNVKDVFATQLSMKPGRTMDRCLPAAAAVFAASGAGTCGLGPCLGGHLQWQQPGSSHNPISLSPMVQVLLLLALLHAQSLLVKKLQPQGALVPAKPPGQGTLPTGTPSVCVCVIITVSDRL